MSTQRQKQAARRNIKAAQRASHRAAAPRGNTLRERDRNDLARTTFAFPEQRKEPLTDATHVRNAIARFDQVAGVSEEDRELAFANIQKAAEYFGIDMTETDWHQLGRSPQTGRTAEDRRKSARKAAATRKRHKIERE